MGISSNSWSPVNPLPVHTDNNFSVNQHSSNQPHNRTSIDPHSVSNTTPQHNVPSSAAEVISQLPSSSRLHLSRKAGHTIRKNLSSQVGAKTKPRIKALANLSGEAFFTEVEALLDLCGQEKQHIENSVDLNRLIYEFLRSFKDKAIEFACTNPDSNSKKFETPIKSLRRFTRYIKDQTQIRYCDTALFELTQIIPEYARPVPKRAFCIWEGKEISQENLSNLAKFIKLNPDYSLTLITSNPKKVINALLKRHDGKWLMNRLKVEAPDFSDNPLVESAINQENGGPFANHAAASDIARMYALVKKDEDGNSGGLYFDVDCKFHQPLPRLIAPFGIQTLCPPKYFHNGIIAAAPDCDLLETAIKNTVTSYDGRNKDLTWSPDLWVNKRAGFLLPKDAASPTQEQNEADRLSGEIARHENTPSINFTKSLKMDLQDLLANPRQRLTEKFTVEPLFNLLRRDFNFIWGYSRTLNVFEELMGPQKIFELPYDKDWAQRANLTNKRRESIA